MNNKLQRLADEYFRSKLDVVDTANETYKNLIKKMGKADDEIECCRELEKSI